MKEMVLQTDSQTDKTFNSLNISDNPAQQNDQDESYKYSPDNTYSFNNSYNAGHILCQSFGEKNCFI